MRCHRCNGAGKRFVPTNKNAITGNGYTADCPFCNGTGEIEATNDVWRRTCSLEEYATWLWKNIDHGEVIVLWEKYGRPMYKDDNGISRANYTEAMKKWLGEIHNG